MVVYKGYTPAGNKYAYECEKCGFKTPFFRDYTELVEFWAL